MSARLNYGKTFLLGFGFFGVSVIWGVYNAFVPIFLADKFDLSPALIGFFMTLDNIAALFIQPPVGAWSDKLRTPLGRRIPFILVGAPISAVAFGLIPVAAILPLFVACTSTLLLSAALWRTPVVALMPDITPSEFRSQANGIINFMGGVGTIVALQTGGMLYKMNPNFPFWLGSGLVVLAALVVYLFIEEPKEYETTESQPGMLKSLSEVVSDPEKSGLRILLAIFFWFLGFSAVETFFTLYAKNHLGLNEGDGATLLSVLPLFFVLSAIPSGFVAGKLGRRTTISTGLIILIIMLVLLFITPAKALLTGIAPLPLVGIPLVEGGARMLTLAGVLLILGGIGWAFVNINSLPMIVDLTSAARIGTYTGLYYLFSTFSAIVGPNVNGWAVQLTGGNYNIIMLIAPFFMLVALGMMMGVKRGEAVVGE
ncbi:MAG: MFS transporter [Chloroflexi bacterium CFX1]|nr:MFS transporter [Chloroflexi bacterium CFX1]MCK6566607.1 MFS transporter [Anaerolineales bacterium]MCQ3952264.1 MFS transporter [Chloroflexota bacterium]MDL1918527.1 SLC45 family MFS transporter [Chloroflexi bacterium CFX5]NUQ58212.1 MFS transporter [Anaerolineales bacterium]